MRKLKIGQKVKAVAASGGWGRVEPGDIGVISSYFGYNGYEYLVDFPEQEGWKASDYDLQAVRTIAAGDEAEMKSGGKVTVIAIGDERAFVKGETGEFSVALAELIPALVAKTIADANLSSGRYVAATDITFEDGEVFAPEDTPLFLNLSGNVVKLDGNTTSRAYGSALYGELRAHEELPSEITPELPLVVTTETSRRFPKNTVVVVAREGIDSDGEIRVRGRSYDGILTTGYVFFSDLAIV